jgi:hypothetical protein
VALEEGVRRSVCEGEATVVLSIGESVSEADLETAERAGPVVRLAPFAFGSLDGEADELVAACASGTCPRVSSG